MKKTLLALLLSSLIFSCSKDEYSEQNTDGNKLSMRGISVLNNKIIIKEATKKLSKFSHQIGILEVLSVSEINSVYNFKLSRYRKNVNGQDLSTFKNLEISENNNFIIVKFKESNNQVLIDSKKNVKMQFNNKFSDFTEQAVDNLSPQENTELVNLLILYDFVTNPGNENTESTTTAKECDYISIQAEPSRSRALHNLNSEVESFLKSHPDCKKIGSPDSGCLWEDYGCVASQSLVCNGSTCDWF